MPRLADGTVVPHFMGVRNTSKTQGLPDFFDEVAILPGEVTKVIYPDDPSNTSKKFIEYNVTVWRRRGNRAQERIAYRCYQADSFGSVADWFRFSFRASTSAPDKKPVANGATVLIACINGDRSNAYIIGGIPQPNRTEPDPGKAEGRFLHSRFNGVEMRISDDGSFELLVPGATTADGTPDPSRDSNNKGSKLSVAKNGDITIDDQNGDSIKVSPTDKTIELKAAEKLTEEAAEADVKVDGTWKLKASTVTVIATKVNLGGELIPPVDGVVVGSGVDSFTGAPYFALGNSSKTVFAKK
jgi:hypothetical protein